jgi:hypothetical protein
MWIFTSSGFVSIVQHRDEPDTLIVRGRFEGDAARFLGLPREAEEMTTDADYLFRCYAHRDEVAAAMLRAAQGIRYPNFKDSIRAAWRKTLALRVWSTLYREQSVRADQRRGLFVDAVQPNELRPGPLL